MSYEEQRTKQSVLDFINRKRTICRILIKYSNIPQYCFKNMYIGNIKKYNFYPVINGDEVTIYNKNSNFSNSRIYPGATTKLDTFPLRDLDMSDKDIEVMVYKECINKLNNKKLEKENMILRLGTKMHKIDSIIHDLNVEISKED